MTQKICPRCDHIWNYKGNAFWITCPLCRKLFRNVDKELPIKVTKI